MPLQREGRECRVRNSQHWLLRVEGSALVTDFDLAEGSHQTRWLNISMRVCGCGILYPPGHEVNACYACKPDLEYQASDVNAVLYNMPVLDCWTL